MPRLLDLMPPAPEEVRCTSALAMMIDMDETGELLRAVLEEAKHNPVLIERAASLSEGSSRLRDWVLDREIRDVRLNVEERFVVDGEAGRFDLIARFVQGDEPCLLVIEAKVSAAGEHGRQLEVYEKQLKKWARVQVGTAEANAVLCLLQLRAFDDQAWNSDLAAIDHLAGCVSWFRLLDAADELIARRAVEPSDAFALLANELRRHLEELSMTAADYAAHLNDGHKPYPLLVDALEAVAREVANGSPLHKEPRGQEGAVWDGNKNAYSCGYWWRPDGNAEWARLRMEWKWMKDKHSTAPGDWIPDSGSSGYAFSVQLHIDDEARAAQVWSGRTFFDRLRSIVAEVQALIGKSRL